MTNVQDSVFQLFQRVENKHGWMLVGSKQQFYLLMSFDSFHKVSHALAYVTASKNGVSEPEIEDFISLDDKVGENIRSNGKLLRTHRIKCILFHKNPSHPLQRWKTFVNQNISIDQL